MPECMSAYSTTSAGRLWRWLVVEQSSVILSWPCMKSSALSRQSRGAHATNQVRAFPWHRLLCPLFTAPPIQGLSTRRSSPQPRRMHHGGMNSCAWGGGSEAQVTVSLDSPSQSRAGSRCRREKDQDHLLFGNFPTRRDADTLPRT